MRVAVSLAVLTASVVVPAITPVRAATLPPRFQESIVFIGLPSPTAVELLLCRIRRGRWPRYPLAPRPTCDLSDRDVLLAEIDEDRISPFST